MRHSAVMPNDGGSSARMHALSSKPRLGSDGKASRDPCSIPEHFFLELIEPDRVAGVALLIVGKVGLVPG